VGLFRLVSVPMTEYVSAVLVSVYVSGPAAVRMIVL